MPATARPSPPTPTLPPPTPSLPPPTPSLPPTTPAASSTEDRQENVLLRELVAVYSHLSGLASQDSDVDAVVRLVAHRTGSAVVVLAAAGSPPSTPSTPSSPGEVVAAVPSDADRQVRAAVGASQLAAVLAAAARNRRTVALSGVLVPESSVVVAPVVVGNDVVAHLITLRAPIGSGAIGSGAVGVRAGELGDDLTLLLTEHAATVCGIILGRERVVAAAAGRARTDLLEGLLLARDRDAAEADRWAGHLGFVRGTEHHVLTVSVPDTPDRGRILAVAEHSITRGRSTAIVAVRETEVVAVVPGPLEGLRTLAQACRAAVLDRHPGAAVVAGIGGCCGTPGEISRSYGEARSAVEAAGRMGSAPGVLAFDDLGVHRLLLQVPDLGELRAFAADVLGDLVHDRRTGADLLGTLSAWFRSNGSPQRTARELHVHPNTVTYRIRRVEEITGLRLDHYRDRLMAQLACEIVEVLS